MDNLFLYGFPAGALVIGAIAFAFTIWESRVFDRVYGSPAGETPVR